LVHERALGRVSSSFTFAAGSVELVAAIVAGLAAEAIGLRNAAFLAPLGALAAAAILWFSPVRTLRALPHEPRHGRPMTPAEAVVEVGRDRPIGG
jgi:hypothetical protein